jgi:transcriptional regulator with XRE-family HTH domain
MLNGEKVRIARGGITQRKFAEKLGITPSYLCEIEKGSKTNPSYQVMEKLFVVTGQKPAWFLKKKK